MTASPALKSVENIEFIDLNAQQQRIAKPLREAIERVLQHGKYIMGPEVGAFEAQLNAFCGVKHTISCSNGTDAIAMTLMAMDVKPGDAVFVPSFTFAATAEVVSLRGATPVFVDVNPDDYNMSIQSLKAAYKKIKATALNPVGIIPVDLFGLCANYDAIEAFAKEEGLWVIADSAQGLGAEFKGRKVGQMGIATTTSFFPAKPLGCYGDGGAIFTNDDALAEKLRSIRVHGKGSDKYDNVRIGINGRLDTIQAAILIEKLKIFPDEIKSRNVIAARYNQAFEGIIQTPIIETSRQCVWAQYTLNAKTAEARADILAALKNAAVPTAIYYPLPLHLQTAYKDCPRVDNMHVCEGLSKTVFSLPMHPYLLENTQDYIINAVKDAVART